MGKIFNDGLDVLATQPSLHKLYTQICSVYAVSDASRHDHIVQTLRDGLDRLAAAFPWLAGEVVNEGASEGITGTFRIRPTAAIPLVVKDLRRDAAVPSMDALRRAKFPMAMFDESVVAPCMTLNLPGTHVGLVGETGPVFAAQATFIEGGVMLTFAGQHNVMDMTGQASIMRWLSKACAGAPLSADELATGNMDKTTSVALFDDAWQLGPEIDLQLAASSAASPDHAAGGDTTASVSGATPQPSSWRYVEFDAAALTALKAAATQTKPAGRGFVSTDDAICALIWKCTARARAARLDPTRQSMFARAVDARRCLDVPAAYPGALTNMAYCRSTLQERAEAPVGVVASDLRRQLDPAVRDLAYDTRALATVLHRAVDKNCVAITAAVDVATGISLSSWAKVDAYELDFHLGLGRPETVRRPRFTPVESLMYIMPRAPTGEMAVAICVLDLDWERLREDEEWNRYATYIG